MGDYNVAAFDSKLYRFTKLDEDWGATFETTEEDETDQSLTVLKSGKIAAAYVQDDAQTKMSIRSPGESGSVIVGDILVNAGFTKPVIKGLIDGGLVVLYGYDGSVYY